MSRLGAPWLRYVALGTLQLKLLWGIWAHKDLTFGDTSSYFLDAQRWGNHGTLNIVWSPLYTSFFGTLLRVSDDPYFAVTLQRVVILVASGALILFIGRKLLPPTLAWLVAAWWVVLPINWNSLYEVHLFALLPTLAVWAIVAHWDGPWARGAALAILVGSTFLVRNELAIVTGAFAILCVAWERRAHTVRPRRLVAAYGVPSLTAVAVCAFYYWRSYVKFPQISAVFRAKQALNMCQVFAFGYQQRHPAWTANPWTDCQPLMRETFGSGLPTFIDMVRANPRATMEHVAWNLRLVPSGLQLMLFNSASGSVNPDYAPAPLNFAPTLWLSVAVVCVGAAALLVLIRRWARFLPGVRSRTFLMLTMAASATVILVVVPTQRPRPSYLFPVGLMLMLVVGLALAVLLETLGFAQRMQRCELLAIVLVVALVPPAFLLSPFRSDRPLLRDYRRLAPFESVIRQRDTVFLEGEFAGEIRNYLGGGRATVLDGSLLAHAGTIESLPAYLAVRNINLVYLDQAMLSRLPPSTENTGFLEDPGAWGWRRLASHEAPGSRWVLLQLNRSA